MDRRGDWCTDIDHVAKYCVQCNPCCFCEEEGHVAARCPRRVSLHKLQSENKGLWGDLNASKNEVRRLKDQNETLARDNVRLYRDMEKTEKTLMNHRRDENARMKDIQFNQERDVNARIKNIQFNHERELDKERRKVEEMAHSHKQILRTNEVNNNTREELEKVQKDLEGAKNEVQRLKDQNERLALKTLDIEKMEKTLMNLRDENAKGKNIRFELERELDEQRKKSNEVSNNTKDELEKVLKDLEKALQCQRRSETETIEFKNEVKRKENELSSQKITILQLKKIGRNYREKAEAADKREAEAKAHLSAIEGELIRAKSQNSEQCSSRELMETNSLLNSSRERLEELETQVQRLLKEKDELLKTSGKMKAASENFSAPFEREDTEKQELLTSQVSVEDGTSNAAEVEDESPELKVKLRQKILEEQMKSLDQEKENLVIENKRLVNQIELTNVDLKDNKISELGGKVAQLECTVLELTQHIQDNRASMKELTDEKDLSIKSLNETIREEESLRDKLEQRIIGMEEALNRVTTEKYEKENLIQSLNDQKKNWIECEKVLSAQIKVKENENEAFNLSSKLANEQFSEKQQELKQSEDYVKTLKEQIEIKETAMQSLKKKLNENEIVKESMLRKCLNYEKYFNFSISNDENIQRYVKEKEDSKNKLNRELEKIERENRKRVSDVRLESTIDQGSFKRKKMDLS